MMDLRQEMLNYLKMIRIITTTGVIFLAIIILISIWGLIIDWNMNMFAAVIVICFICIKIMAFCIKKIRQVTSQIDRVISGNVEEADFLIENKIQPLVLGRGSKMGLIFTVFATNLHNNELTKFWVHRKTYDWLRVGAIYKIGYLPEYYNMIYMQERNQADE